MLLAALRTLPDISGAALADLPEASGVAFHSASVRPGDIFFALPGEQGHGLTFADAALAAGAAFIISDRPHPRGVRVADPLAVLLDLGRQARAQLKGPVIGVTGSAGKTSTKAMLAAVTQGRVSPGNYNTPPALARVLIDSWLAAESGSPSCLCMELGVDRPGDMKALLELVRPSHGLITLIAESHLEKLGDVAAVAREKGALVDAAESVWVSAQAYEKLSPERQRKVRRYALTDSPAENADYQAQLSAAGSLRLHGAELTLPVPSRAMATNATGVMALATELGIPTDVAAARLAQAVLEPGRLSVIQRGDVTLIDDSYNSNPASAREALNVLEHYPKPHTIILGDMLELGAISETAHRELGELTRSVDRVIALGPAMQALKEVNPRAQYFTSFDAASAHIDELPLSGTILIKASRGMRFERLVERLQARLERLVKA